MPTKILLAYASKYGSTREVAEAIATSLSAAGLTVDLLPARKVASLAGYRAVVLGAPFYIGSWHKDALQFLARHQAALTSLPVTVFALGPTHPGDEAQGDPRGQLDETLAKHPWLKPVTAEMFGGKYDPARLRLPDSLLAMLPASPLHGAPASDLRDWGVIRSWASSLAALLQPVMA